MAASAAPARATGFIGVPRSCGFFAVLPTMWRRPGGGQTKPRDQGLRFSCNPRPLGQVDRNETRAKTRRREESMNRLIVTALGCASILALAACQTQTADTA